MPWAIIAARCAGSLRIASRPPCTRGCSVFSRPSIISGKPVSVPTSTTATPLRASAVAVPPVETISTPRTASARPSSTRPDLSETEIRARPIGAKSMLILRGSQSEEEFARPVSWFAEVRNGIRRAGNPSPLAGEGPRRGDEGSGRHACYQEDYRSRTNQQDFLAFARSRRLRANPLHHPALRATFPRKGGRGKLPASQRFASARLSHSSRYASSEPSAQLACANSSGKGGQFGHDASIAAP